MDIKFNPCLRLIQALIITPMKLKLTLASALLFSVIGMSQVTFSTQGIGTNRSDRAVVDMNGDFLDDIISVATSSVQVFYQQPDGTFIEDVLFTTPADNLPSWSLAAADYDGNGYTDLLYGGGNGVTFMRANANGTGFDEVSFPQYVFSQRSNFVDINNDGHLDAFVCHDVEPNVYYINDGFGNLTFNQGGIGDYPTGGHYGSVWIDFDNDGDMDMFNAKCGGGPDRRTDQLHQNDGAGSFIEIGATAGVADAMSTWSSAWGDYNNDGYMDVFVGNSVDPEHKLMTNNGDGTFTNVTAGSGVEDLTTTGIENCAYDFDNDGYIDIVSNGNIFFNNGDMTFTLETDLLPSNNGAFGDLNNDGFVDSFTGSTIFKNNGNTNHYLTINTVGVQSNRNGIGARVSLTSGLGTQIRDVRSGEGFRLMSTLNTHFGLGQDTEIAIVTITWPSGIVDVLEDVAVDQTIVIVEGSTTLGTQDHTGIQLIVSPNPAKDLITITGTTPFTLAQYDVFDMQGKVVLNGSLGSGQINVSTLAQGTYVVRLTNGSSVNSQQFIKR
ncbi:MAG: hypothetical protein ABR84_00740 [Cryomorphaceae bacterium BACL21 MAG-121220-bin10]|jgi:hypothetical protein|nr:MAG: hypothetical protein ABR84_00740 [Cryomorphaceae bacterium BACL21 MAG-121220-bin10]